MPAMVMEFRSRGIPAMVRDMQKLAAVGQQVASVQRQVQAAGLGGGGGGMGLARVANAVVANPAQAQIRQQRQQAQALNAHVALQRARQRYAAYNQSQQPPSLVDRIGRVAMSSRYNIGNRTGGVSPLVGQTLGALGLSRAAMGPVGIAIGAIVLAGTAARALADAAQEGAEKLRSISAAAAMTGGTGAQVAKLAGLGLTAEGINALRDRLASDPQARLAAAQIGMRPVQSTRFGSQNSAAVVLDLLNNLKRLPEEERLRKARMIGPEAVELLPHLDASQKALKEWAKTREALGNMSDRAKVATADFKVGADRLKAATDRLKGSAFNVLGDKITYAANKLADMMDAFSAWAEKHEGWAKGIARFLFVTAASIGGGPNAGTAAAAFWDHLQGGANGAKGQADALNANTQQLQANTDALLKNQIYGGGSRASGAIPANLNGQMLNNAWRNSSLRLSPF